MMRNSLMDQKRVRPMLIGITGGVGCGKTRVLSFLKEKYACMVIQADVIANDLKKPGNACYQATIDLLGQEILNEDQSINNKKMGRIIFSSPELLKKINELFHPVVQEEIDRIILDERKKGEVDFLFVEAALLVEAGYQEMFDVCWYIFTSKDVCLARLISDRGYTDEKARKIMSKQLSSAEFEAACHVIIDNSGNWVETEKQIVLKMEEYSWEKN